MATSTIRMTGRTSASAVSKQLRRLGYNPYGAHETRYGGYIVKDWLDGPEDTQGGRIVRVYYDGIHRELKSPVNRQEREREKARLERMKDMLEDLKTIGYFVVWGWKASTGRVDNSFLVVSGSPARLSDIPGVEEVVVPQEPVLQEAVEIPAEKPQEPVQEPAAVRHGAFPVVPLLGLEGAEEGVRMVQKVALTDPATARQMEGHLYYLALVAVVSGSEEAVDVAAIVLQTQGTLLPR